MFGKNWVVRKTIWPFPNGYGVYNTKTKTILETGITKREAQQICDELNRKKK